jgi:hypothetical protein
MKSNILKPMSSLKVRKNANSKSKKISDKFVVLSPEKEDDKQLIILRKANILAYSMLTISAKDYDTTAMNSLQMAKKTLYWICQN